MNLIRENLAPLMFADLLWSRFEIRQRPRLPLGGKSSSHAGGGIGTKTFVVDGSCRKLRVNCLAGGY